MPAKRRCGGLGPTQASAPGMMVGRFGISPLEVVIMDSAALIDRMEAQAGTVRHLVEGIPADQAVWKPDPKTWSILEVTVHLLDEEREDFRVRLGLILSDPSAEWPAIDPQGWVSERNYVSRDLQESLLSFLEERQASLVWLWGLTAPAWTTAKTHPIAGSMTAGDLLASWASHDLLHIRQLAKLHWDYVQHLAGPYASNYAGEW